MDLFKKKTEHLSYVETYGETEPVPGGYSGRFSSSAQPEPELLEPDETDKAKTAFSPEEDFPETDTFETYVLVDPEGSGAEEDDGKTVMAEEPAVLSSALPEEEHPLGPAAPEDSSVTQKAPSALSEEDPFKTMAADSEMSPVVPQQPSSPRQGTETVSGTVSQYVLIDPDTHPEEKKEEKREAKPVSKGKEVTPSAPLLPVVGWLICVKGPEKGREYRIHEGYNYAGSETGDLILRGDPKISPERHFAITYLPRKRRYFISPDAGISLLSLNGEELLANERKELQNYDRIEVGDSGFLFLALCGERFGWEDAESLFDWDKNLLGLESR